MCAFFDVLGEGRDSRVKSHTCLSFKAIKWQTVPTMATTQVPVLRERDKTTLEWPKLYIVYPLENDSGEGDLSVRTGYSVIETTA